MSQCGIGPGEDMSLTANELQSAFLFLGRIAYRWIQWFSVENTSTQLGLHFRPCLFGWGRLGACHPGPCLFLYAQCAYVHLL